jgi:hypothetical protein
MGGITRLTVTHELEGARFEPGESKVAGGGWPWILSDMKSLLETGKSIAG